MSEDTPSTLTEEQIGRAVAEMEGWSGDVHRLLREVPVPSARVDAFLDEVHRIEDELNHHAQIESPPTEDEEVMLTFKIWTHTVGGVTELDLDLARRIDQEIATLD